MKQKDASSIYAELDKLQEKFKDTAIKSTDLKEYLPSRNEFRIAIIESEIPANEKNFYFTALTGCDIDFFNQNWGSVENIHKHEMLMTTCLCRL